MGREPSANFHENAANEGIRVSRHRRAKRRRGARVSVSPPPSRDLIRWSVTIARLSSRDTRDATRWTRRSSASSAPRVEGHAPASPRLAPLTRRYRVARRPDRASASRRVVRTQNRRERRDHARLDRDARRTRHTHTCGEPQIGFGTICLTSRASGNTLASRTYDCYNRTNTSVWVKTYAHNFYFFKKVSFVRLNQALTMGYSSYGFRSHGLSIPVFPV